MHAPTPHTLVAAVLQALSQQTFEPEFFGVSVASTKQNHPRKSTTYQSTFGYPLGRWMVDGPNIMFLWSR
eukprot:m.207269 g.207269  ORF g.207269 m.207269 type:complete len:70 (+) comp18924_c0_seq2:565-774(+)